MKFNSFLDYNEKNFGLVKLRMKYPKESEEQIYTRLLGHVPSTKRIASRIVCK